MDSLNIHLNILYNSCCSSHQVSVLVEYFAFAITLQQHDSPCLSTNMIKRYVSLIFTCIHPVDRHRRRRVGSYSVVTGRIMLGVESCSALHDGCDSVVLKCEFVYAEPG